MKARAAALAVAMLIGAVAGAGGAADRAEDVGRWTQRKAIVLPALTAPGFVEAVLDADVYRDAAATLADVRVRENDRDVAYDRVRLRVSDEAKNFRVPVMKVTRQVRPAD